MSRVLHLSLILLLALTGIGLGAARGTAVLDGQVVLCSGHGVVMVHQPDSPFAIKAHICPDMALSLMSAQTAEPPVLPERLATALIHILPVDHIGIGRSAPPAWARGPPSTQLL
ncbi:hypothetical protein JJJ17_01875 [Paracoccus caeni]|uniref:DUF2946 domain-containing protein n=1 Tax=Paracoccus caeni TaxID=657651 RepID=A0A934SGB9_9RHOB|nr:hypothetical protein [Paracoccus caeni]MBK4214669.1 hypothetical protein [Paracoccus caeni]